MHLRSPVINSYMVTGLIMGKMGWTALPVHNRHFSYSHTNINYFCITHKLYWLLSSFQFYLDIKIH